MARKGLARLLKRGSLRHVCTHVFAGVPSLDGMRVMIKTVVLMMILLLMMLMLRRVRVMTRHTHAQTPTHVLLLALLVGLSSGNSSRKSFLLGLSMTGAERARGERPDRGGLLLSREPCEVPGVCLAGKRTRDGQLPVASPDVMRYVHTACNVKCLE